MKYLLLLVLSAGLLTACDTSQEDRDFYYSGWLHPERDSNRRIYGGDVQTGQVPQTPP